MNWKVERLSCSLWTKISQLICLSPSPSCFFICHFVVKISQLKTHQPWEKLCMIETGTWTVWLWHNCCLFLSKPCGKYYVLAGKSHDTLYTDILNLFLGIYKLARLFWPFYEKNVLKFPDLVITRIRKMQQKVSNFRSEMASAQCRSRLVLKILLNFNHSPDKTD